MRHNFIVWVAISSLLIATSLSAGTTGKIAGSVRDANTGEPLIGANVILKGTYLGASTDVDGYFFIINVPVGEYTLEISMIGYQTVIYPKVRVMLDQTTKLDFKLKEQAIKGEAVVVIAEQEVKVEKDVTTKKVIIDRKEINSLPVRDFSDLVEAQAGIIRIEGSLKGIPGFEDRGIEEIHVRGGRTAEVAYLVDGMYTENPIYGGRYKGIQLNKYAQEQVDIKTGVFNAEYGDAMSSIINIVSRTASDHYEGNLNVESSAFGFEPDRLRNYSRFSGAIGGPIPFLGKNVTLMLSGRRTDRKYNVYEFDDLVFDPSDTLAN
ncbi:MAG TPA: TonB-dependent receptor, partial [Caldithrix sp.]|nr:TonB-dependent receptor [Caldithrix sp.]